nr:hypothetical protein [Tanacetum cinerariifolium]
RRTGSRPRAPHELPLLTLTAPRVIEMDELAAATDSSGVSSAIERSPLDFADEAEASGRETAAPEMPPPEEVPITTVPGGNQAAETVAVEPPAVRESRKRGHEGIDANAPPKSLRRDHADLRPSECWAESRIGKNERLSQQVDALQQHVSGEESLKAAFEDYKRQQDRMVEQRSAEMDACLDAMSIDFDEELYPHMLTAIAGRRWVIRYGMRLATMKCAESLEMRQAFADVVSAGIAKGMSEGLKHGVEHGHAQRTIESLEAYDPEAEDKFATALQSLKDLKIPLLDQLEGLKDALMDVIMASLYLEDDTGGVLHNLYATSVPAPPSLPSRYHSPSVAKRFEDTFVGPAGGLEGCSDGCYN